MALYGREHPIEVTEALSERELVAERDRLELLLPETDGYVARIRIMNDLRAIRRKLEVIDTAHHAAMIERMGGRLNLNPLR